MSTQSAHIAVLTLLTFTLCGLLRQPAAAATDTSVAKAPSTTSTPVRVPFIVGLTTLRAVSTPNGDYETLRTIESIDASGYRIVVSGEVPADDGGEAVNVKVRRKISAADQAAAHRMRNYFHEDDDESFPGTVPGFSAATVKQLKTSAKAQMTYLDVQPFFGQTMVVRELSGVLTRANTGTLPVLVNGRMAELPIIHAKGILADGEDKEPFDYVVLDDPANPIVLRAEGNGASTAIVRIEYPEPNAAPTSIESSLAKREIAKIYGIYFSFNLAVLRPESDRVLKEIGSIMKAHPDWKLRVDGHTDGIGNDKANLDLSRRRTDAVKAALVTRYGIDPGRLTTAGYGESAPQDTNDTPEGRARNRRVELRRE